MIYQIAGKTMLFTLDRTEIIDISSGDILEIKGFPGARYEWTNHDMEFLENNPDDDLFLEVERVTDNAFRAARVVLKE
jgi:hypothetical protein